MSRRGEGDDYYRGPYDLKDVDCYSNSNSMSEKPRAKEPSQSNTRTTMSNALKSLLIAMEMKQQEEKHFRDEVLASATRRGGMSRDQLSFIASELKLSRADRSQKATEIDELKKDVRSLKCDLELLKTVLQSFLGGTLSSQPGSALSSQDRELPNATARKRGVSNRPSEIKVGEEKDNVELPEISSQLGHTSSQTSQFTNGESHTKREYEKQIISESEAPRTSLRKYSGSDSSLDNPIKMKMGRKRKHSSVGDNIEEQKKVKDDSWSDNSMEKSQQPNGKLFSGSDHPLLKPRIMSLVVKFVGKGNYLFVCGVHKVWKSAYLAEYESSKCQTYTTVSLASVSVLNYAYECDLDLKHARFKSKATGSPLSLSWWSGHVAPFSTILRFHELRKGDPMNICGGAASAGRLDIIRHLLEKQKWNCDNASICINAAEAPTPNVLQWLFLNNIGTWDPASVSAMLKSAALFNRHKNAHFLSLVPKFQNKERQRKALINTALVELDAPIDPKNIHSNTRRGAAKHQNILLDNSANDGSTATRGPPVSTEPALKDTRLPTLEKRPSISTGNTDNVVLKKKDMLEIAMAAIGYVDKKCGIDKASSSQGANVEKSGVSHDREKSNNKGQSEVDLKITSENRAESETACRDEVPTVL